MHFAASRTDLAEATAAVVGVADRKNASSVFDHMLVRAGPDGLEVRAQDPEVWSRYSCPAAEVVEEGAAAVPAWAIHSLVSRLPKGATVVVRSTGPGAVEVVSGRTTAQFPALAASDYPLAPDERHTDDECSALISGGALRSLARVVFAASSDPARPGLCGARIEVVGRTIRLVATDGHRLAMSECALSAPADHGIEAIVPTKWLTVLGRAIGAGPDREVGIVFRGDTVTCEVDRRAEITARLIDASFPDYRRVVLPLRLATPANVDGDELSEVLSRLPPCTRGKASLVGLRLADGELEVSSEDPVLGRTSERIGAEFRGPVTAQSFNLRYLRDALKTVPPGAGISLALSDDKGPMFIRFGGPAPCEHVVMPVRP